MDVMTTPLFTVLMPVYNAERFLAEAIESILDQTLRDFEFLIINDGSIDGSLDIIREYEQQDSRIRVISRPNKGFIASLEEGLRESTTDLIIRADSDDVSLPTRFEKQYSYMVNNPDYNIVGCQVQTMDENGNKGDIDPRPTTDMNLKLFLGYGCALSGPTVMFHRQSVLSVGGFLAEGWPAEDYDCWTRMVMDNPLVKCFNLPEVLYLYRSNSKGISMTNKNAQIQKTIDVGREYRVRMLMSNWQYLTYDSYKEWFSDLGHVNEEQAESLVRIYYTIQSWFINDEMRIRPIKASVNRFKLYLFTRFLNKKYTPYLHGLPHSHTFPDEVQS